MRLRQTVARLGNAEVAVMRVSAQAVGDKILVAVMADRDALFRPGARPRANSSKSESEGILVRAEN
jgi:hypothetical protein